MSRKNDNQKQTKGIVNVFFGIIIFVMIFFPFFAINWKYQLGAFFSIIIAGIGKFTLLVGALCIILGIFFCFTKNLKNAISYAIIGATLLWIAVLCT